MVSRPVERHKASLTSQPEFFVKDHSRDLKKDREGGWGRKETKCYFPTGKTTWDESVDKSCSVPSEVSCFLVTSVGKDHLEKDDILGYLLATCKKSWCLFPICCRQKYIMSNSTQSCQRMRNQVFNILMGDRQWKWHFGHQHNYIVSL